MSFYELELKISLIGKKILIINCVALLEKPLIESAIANSYSLTYLKNKILFSQNLVSVADEDSGGKLFSKLEVVACFSDEPL